MGRFSIYAADLRQLASRTGSRSGLRWMHDEDDLSRLPGLGEDRDWLDTLRMNGAHIALAEEGGQIIGLNIYHTSGTPHYTNLVPVLREHDIIAMWGFVIPEYRGQKILADIKAFAARHFCDLGYRRMISVVRANNRASVRAHAKVGATPSFTLSRLRVGNFMIVHYRSSIRLCRVGRNINVPV